MNSAINPFDKFINDLKQIKAGKIWRYGVAGDLPGKNNSINTKELSQIVEANKGKQGFAYTHKPVLGKSKTVEKNQAAIKNANENGLVINLSADSIKEADEKKALNIAPVVVVVKSDVKKNFITPAGNRVVICPNTTHGVQCIDCKLCAKPRNIIIGFPAHGTWKNKLDKILN